MSARDGVAPKLTVSRGNNVPLRAAERRRLEAVAQMFRDLYAARVGTPTTSHATCRHLRLVSDDLQTCPAAPELRRLKGEARRSVG